MCAIHKTSIKVLYYKKDGNNGKLRGGDGNGDLCLYCSQYSSGQRNRGAASTNVTPCCCQGEFQRKTKRPQSLKILGWREANRKGTVMGAVVLPRLLLWGPRCLVQQPKALPTESSSQIFLLPNRGSSPKILLLPYGHPSLRRPLGDQL